MVGTAPQHALSVPVCSFPGGLWITRAPSLSGGRVPEGCCTRCRGRARPSNCSRETGHGVPALWSCFLLQEAFPEHPWESQD